MMIPGFVSEMGIVTASGIGGARIAVGEFCQSEVENFNEAIAHEAILPQHDVLGFDVAVNDAGGVRGFERHRDLDRDAESFVEFQRLAPETVAQRFAFDVFRGDVILISRFANLVDSEYIGVVQRQDGARFLFETADPAFRASEFFGEDLESDLASVLFGVFAEQDFAHAALAEPAHDAIMGDVLGRRIVAH